MHPIPGLEEHGAEARPRVPIIVPRLWGAEPRGSCKARRRTDGNRHPHPQRAPACPSRKPSGGRKSGARAPAHRPGSAPRPAARSRPRAEATQSRSPTQRRWRRRQRQQRGDPRGRYARALRAHCTHPSRQPCCPPAALRWRRRKRPGERQPRAGSAGGAPPSCFGLPDPGAARSGTVASWGSYLPEADSRGCGHTFCSTARFAASASPSPAPLPPSCVPARDSALRMRRYRL